MSQNYLYVDIFVDHTEMRRTSRGSIPSLCENYIYLRFTFAQSWQELTKVAILSKKGLPAIHLPIENDLCQIPGSFMSTPGDIVVSLFAGSRRTVNEIIIPVYESGYKSGTPPSPQLPDNSYVQTPDGSVLFIREHDEMFQYFADGKFKTIQSSGTSDQIQADWEEENIQKKAYIKNRPKINDIILKGNRMLPETPLTNIEIESLFK